MSDVTKILSEIGRGDPRASAGLLPLVYDQLRTLAKARMAGERPDHTLQATSLVHEAYMRLVDVNKVQDWNSRGHFFSAAAEAMRRILVESARSRNSLKRGGDRQQIEIIDVTTESPAVTTEQIIEFNDALDVLAKEDAEAAELVKLRIFAGLEINDAAKVLGMSRSMAFESWQFARAWFACRFGSAQE